MRVRQAGPLTLSPELESFLRICEAHAERERRRGGGSGGFAPENTPHLALEAVLETERSLHTTLPDDFWALAACGIPVVAGEGIASTMPHGECAAPRLVPEMILTAASEGEGNVPEDLVAIADHSGIYDSEAGPAYEFLCVRKDVQYEARNDQEVVPVREGERLPSQRFANFMRDRLERSFGVMPPAASRRPLIPTLLPANVGTSAERRVRHAKFGLGTVRGTTESGSQRKLDVDFDEVGRKVLLEEFVTPVK